ncbi:cilia and flagella associated protein 410 [Boleophthalmus pectinirostris]|uniref:cilia and flagella associated protein 410 n=1 Tax=Boleophthalmus pectinirostris TaxID=150288 RepID=UPI000A1C5D0B|nr:cilia and flagella associated protein 410 [Boleophthalmus pectinirostris]
MKLSRKLVLAKAKASDLDSVKKLNCWGCNLTDISIFTLMSNIEVLTLSVNSITSLAPLASCLNLCELYLRRNMISSLSELSHLRLLGRLKVLWLAENPCCGTDPNKYRLTVLRCLPRLQKLDNQVVTEEEVALALTQGEEVTTPTDPVQNQLSTNGQPDTETENDPLEYSMDETNKIREQLGMRPLPRDKFPSLSSPSTRENRLLTRKSHTLDAILLLLKDLDEDELHVVHTATQNRLQMFTLNSEMMKNSLQTKRTVDIED